MEVNAKSLNLNGSDRLIPPLESSAPTGYDDVISGDVAKSKYQPSPKMQT